MRAGRFAICAYDVGMTASPIIVVGLGNPGPKYEGTRHNVGVHVIEELAGRATMSPATLALHKRTNTQVAELAAGRLLADRRVVLARTQSYMNVSGGPVKALLDYFDASPADLYVVHDELDLPLGEVKLRTGGGDHGHNGLKSVTQSLSKLKNGKNYNKLAVGIGRPPGKMPPADYVLRQFAAKEQIDVAIAVADAADAFIAHAQG